MKKNITRIEIENQHILEEHSYCIKDFIVDDKRKKISFNSEDLKNIKCYSSNKCDVISVFKRKKSGNFDLDGNDLIYALKGLNNWKTENSKEDIVELMKCFIKKQHK